MNNFLCFDYEDMIHISQKLINKIMVYSRFVYLILLIFYLKNFGNFKNFKFINTLKVFYNKIFMFINNNS